MDKFITSLDEQFELLQRKSRELLEEIPPALLYLKPPASDSSSSYSCGEELLRSAAIVERTFGGISANLWDDPFEWTLPETLTTAEKVGEYLDEVEATRKRGFELFQSDADLLKEVMAPGGGIQLRLLLLDTLERADVYQQRARSTLKLLAEESDAAVSECSG